jgi:Leucine rich repeat/Bacterial Ig-like domain
MPARAVHRFLEVVPMNPARMFTSLIAILSFVFVLNACTSPTTGDTTRPTVTSVTSTSNSSVNVVFSEAIVGAGTANKFSITPALGVTAASVSSDGQTVTLTTASQTKNTKYALGVASSIKDTAGNVVNPTPASALAFTGRGGKLTVTVTGLPAGVNPDVVMSEADTSSQQVTATSVVLDNVGSGTLSFAVKAVKPDAATFSDDSSPKSLDFVAGAGGSVALKYACSAVKPPDDKFHSELQRKLNKEIYNCTDLAGLTKLDVFSSNITNIDGIQYATGLTNLGLSNNSISSLPEGIFNKLTQLTRLDMTSNLLSSLPEGIFDKLTKLTDLNISINRIRTLPSSLINKLSTLTTLDLSSNCFATEQEPLKTILAAVQPGVLKKDGNSLRAGCPQKTISIASIETQKLTTAHGSLTGETIYLKTRIDGVAQADGDPIFAVVAPGNPLNINQSLFVLSELHIELFTQDTAGDIKIGEATLTIDNPYTVGLVIPILTENDAVYVLKLEKK